jgi:hypothetical protein
MTARTQIALVPGAAAHVASLAPRLRRIDRIECAAMGRTGEQALRHGLAASVETWTALIGGEPQAMFGVVVDCAASGEAIPWFLGSRQVAGEARALISQGPAIVAAMHRHGRWLRNFVSCENRAAIRLLEHWGFTVEQEFIAVRGIAFRRFIRESV